MGYYDGLVGEIERFENINNIDLEYDEKRDYFNYYDKNDVLDAIKKYSNELKGENNPLIAKFIKAIGHYIEDEEVLTELFKRNGKVTLDAISTETDLLTSKEKKILVYRCAIDASNRNIQSMEQKIDEENVWLEELKKKRDRALRSKFSTKEEKQAELSELILENGKLEELLEKARLWDEMQKKQTKESKGEEKLENDSSDATDELYDDESEIDL